MIRVHSSGMFDFPYIILRGRVRGKIEKSIGEKRGEEYTGELGKWSGKDTGRMERQGRKSKTRGEREKGSEQERSKDDASVILQTLFGTNIFLKLERIS